MPDNAAGRTGCLGVHRENSLIELAPQFQRSQQLAVLSIAIYRSAVSIRERPLVALCLHVYYTQEGWLLSSVFTLELCRNVKSDNDGDSQHLFLLQTPFSTGTHMDSTPLHVRYSRNKSHNNKAATELSDCEWTAYQLSAQVWSVPVTDRRHHGNLTVRTAVQIHLCTMSDSDSSEDAPQSVLNCHRLRKRFEASREARDAAVMETLKPALAQCRTLLS